MPRGDAGPSPLRRKDVQQGPEGVVLKPELTRA